MSILPCWAKPELKRLWPIMKLSLWHNKIQIFGFCSPFQHRASKARGMDCLLYANEMTHCRRGLDSVRGDGHSKNHTTWLEGCSFQAHPLSHLSGGRGAWHYQSPMVDDPINQVCIREPPFKTLHGTSLVVRWAGICLPMQETQVWSLVKEDSTCHGVTKAHMPQLLKTEWLEPVLHKRSPHTTTRVAPTRRN